MIGQTLKSIMQAAGRATPLNVCTTDPHLLALKDWWKLNHKTYRPLVHVSNGGLDYQKVTIKAGVQVIDSRVDSAQAMPGVEVRE